MRLRISKIVKTTPKVNTAAMSANIRDSDQLSLNAMLKINAALDALTIPIRHAKAVPFVSLAAA